MSTNKAVAGRVGLVSIVGGIAAAGLLQLTPSFEGTVYRTYRDLGGVLTYCTGATEDAQWGKTYTPAQCRQQLDYDLARHAEGISKCVDMAKLTDGQKVAFVDFAYNVGVGAFCGSTLARKANAGDMTGACAGLSDWDGITKWQKDKHGKLVKVHVTVAGLVKRRAVERAICEGKRTA
jgi:lysozyme